MSLARFIFRPSSVKFSRYSLAPSPPSSRTTTGTQASSPWRGSGPCACQTPLFVGAVVRFCLRFLAAKSIRTLLPATGVSATVTPRLSRLAA